MTFPRPLTREQDRVIGQLMLSLRHLTWEQATAHAEAMAPVILNILRPILH